MKIIDERKSESSRFDELPIGAIFHEVADDTNADAPLYIKLSDDPFASKVSNWYNTWSINEDAFCLFEAHERVVKLNVEIIIKN